MKDWTPVELIFQKTVEKINMDPVEHIFQKIVEKYGPHGTYFSKDSWKIRPIWNTLKRATEKYETLLIL